MDMRCIVGLHQAEADPVWNAGYFVSRCRRCESELIRLMHGYWKPVPKGHRIVWKEKPASYPDWNSLSGTSKAETLPVSLAATQPSPEPVRLRLIVSDPALRAAPNVPTFRDWQRQARSSAG